MLHSIKDYFHLLYLDKPVSIDVNRVKHYSLMNNTVASKIKYFSQLFGLGPQTPLKQK